MRITKHEELVLLRTGLESLRKARHSRIMRGRSEAGDAREYIVLCNLIDRVEEHISAIKNEVLAVAREHDLIA